MVSTIIIGICTCIPFTLAILYSSQDLEEISLSGLPIMTLYVQVFSGNSDAALFFTFWILFIYFGATIGLVVTSGRLLWAFARDNGLPFSSVFAKIHPTLKMPRNATLLTAGFCILYGLIYIGSTLAFNSFVATAILSLNLTYTIPQTLLLLRSLRGTPRTSMLPARPFSLGPWFGPFCNLFATLWTSLYCVIFCFPIFLPVTVDTMSYVVVVMAGTALFIGVIWWLPSRLGGKRGVFVGPQVAAVEEMGRVNVNRGLSVVGEEEGKVTRSEDLGGEGGKGGVLGTEKAG